MASLGSLFARFLGLLKTGRLRNSRRAGTRKRVRAGQVSRVWAWEALEPRVLLATITSNSFTPGVDYVLSDPDEIVIAANVVIDTSSQTGHAGKISLTAPKITLQAGAQLLATGATGDGAISLTAHDTVWNPKISAANQLEDLALVVGNRKLQSDISIAAGVEIDGGDVSFSTESGNPADNPVYDQVVSLIVQPLGPFLMEALEKPDLFAGPLAFQLWRPSATIAIDSASISSSGTVTITSTADASASGKAVYNRVVKKGGFDGSGNFGGAAGYFETDAVATIQVTGTTSIESEGELQLATTVDNAVALEVLAVKNNGITVTNPRAIDFAGGYTVLNTTSTITVEEGSSLVAGGSVEIAAEATDENEVGVTANAYRDGTIGAAFGMMQTGATVQVIVAGSVVSGVAESVPADLPEVTFNPALVVDFNTDSLVFPDPVEFTTGDPLYFTTASGATIPGLVPGSVYFAIGVPGNPNQLQLAATREQALAGEAISFGSPFPTLTIGGQTIPITTVDTAVSNSLLFGYSVGENGSPLLQSGDLVTYTPVAGRFLGYNDSSGNLVGALPAGSYTVQVVDSINPELFPLAIQLLSTASTPVPNLVLGTVVPLNDSSLLTTATGVTLPIYGFEIDSSQLDLNAPTVDPATGQPVTSPATAIPLQNAEAVVFHSGLNNPTGNLVDGQTYYAIVDPANPGVIRLAQTQAQAVAQNPAIQNAVPHLVTVANQSFLQSTSASFGPNQELWFQQNADGSYRLWSNANQGTFTLTAQTPQGTTTTAALAYNADAAQLQSALNGLTGLVTTVTGSGSEADPWQIAGQFVLAIGTFENGTDVVFDFDPGLAAGTAVQYEAVAGKPIAGLTDGTTYFAFPAANASFNANLPQYLLTLSGSATSSTPSIAVSLSQSLTDSQGNVYTITGVAAESGQLLVDLPQSAAVTSVDPSGLTGGIASVGTIPAGTVQYLTFATAGTFTLSVDLGGGSPVTTPSLAWNASAAEIEAALNALAGVQVQVTGTGTYTSPWTIAGLTLDQISSDSTALLRNGKATDLMQRELTAPASQVSTTASGGTITLSLTAGGVTQTTPAIAWNATADEVAAAINANLTGLRASVTGTGQPDDPWQITAGRQSITTGMPLTFHDSWNLPNLGLSDGQTCYAVVMADQVVPQTLILGLAATAAEALQATPVLINQQPWYPFTTATAGILTGAPATLSELPPEGEHPGIAVIATLESSDSAKSSANLGLFPLMAYVVHPHGNWLPEHGSHRGIEQELAHKIPPGKNLPNSWELTAAPAVAEVGNTVQALVLGSAVLQTAGAVTIATELTEIIHSTSTASIAKPTLGENDKAVAIAFNLALVDNTAQAVIAPGAQVTGTSGVSVTSEIEYPFVLRETNLSGYRQGTLPSSTTNVTQTVENILGNALFSSMGGISKWLFNHLANSAFAAEESRDADLADPSIVKERALGWSIGFSLSVIEITNNNLAQISDGAQINQIEELVGTDQPVVVEAQTNMVQTSTAGQVFPGLSLLWLQYAIKKSSPTDVFDLTSAQTAIGGSLVQFDLQNSTQALVGGDCLATAPAGVTFTAPDVPSTAIAFGTGGLTVEALNLLTNVVVVQAGAKSSGFGFEGSFGMLDLGNSGDTKDTRKQTTRAQLLTTNRPLDLQANAGTHGNVEVSAQDTSDLWVVSGAVLWGAPRGIGLSGSVISADRDVAAGEGTADLGDPATQTSLWNLGGSLEISANTAGVFATASLVGEYAGRSGPAEALVAHGGDELGEGAENAASGNTARWGLNVSGDFAGIFLEDSTTAWLADEGTVSGGADGTVGVASTNSTLLHAVSGSASIVDSKETEDLTAGISGSAAVISGDAVVESQIASVTLAGLTAEVSATNNKLAGSFAGGMQVAVVSAADLNLAGSVAVNTLTNTTSAEVVDVTGTGLHELAVEATASDEVWASAGLVSVTLDRRELENIAHEKPKTIIGVGASGAVNELTNSTTAQVVDSDLEFAGGAATVEASDFTRSLVLSAGVDVAVAAGSNVTVGGMFATTAFRPNTQALITGSSLSTEEEGSGENLEVLAVLVPALVSTAGYVAATWGKEFSTKQTEVGVGVGAGVVVTNFNSQGTDLAQTVAQVTDSELDWNTGDVTVEAYSGQMTTAFENADTATKVGNDSLYLLAVAGSAQGEGGNTASVGVDIAGAVIVTNLALATSATIDSGSQVTTEGALEVLATEAFTSKTDAGGAVIAEQGLLKSETAVGVAIGGGWNEWNASNQIEASVSDSEITAESLEVAALLESVQTQIAFGVAVDLALSDGVGVSASLSGAWAYHTLGNTISATVDGGTLELDHGFQVTADDETSVTLQGGAGTLAVASGAGAAVAVAPSAAVGSISVSNTIEALVGTTGTAAADTALSVGGPVEIAATDAATFTSSLTAVAAAVGASEAGVALSGSGTTASISTTNTVQALLGEGVSLEALAGQSVSLSVSADENATLSATVGAGALVVAPFGGSLGISLAEVTTADTVTAAITGATVSTSGGDVSVSTETSRQVNTMSVPTSLAISIGAAGAGGNSNITDSSTFAASISDGASINTAETGHAAGNLSVETLGKQSLTAEIDGGAGGVGSIGVFLSTVERSGSLSASLDGVPELNVGNLTVSATAAHTISSTGTSVTIGGLAGSGETHTAEYTETVSTTLQAGPAAAAQVAGAFTALAESSTTVQAEATGAIAGLLGVGAYTAYATFTPTVSTTVDGFSVVASGAVNLSAQVGGRNQAEAIAGSGGLFTAEASLVNLTTSPTTTTKLTSSVLQGSNLSLQAVNQLEYNGYADSVNASVVGYSGAVVNNTAAPTANLLINTGTKLQATAGQVGLGVANSIVNLGGQSSLVDVGGDDELAMVRLGAGGGLVGYSGAIVSNYTPTAELSVADNVTVSGVQGILVTASQGLTTNELAILKTGGLIDVSVTNSNLTATFDTTLTVGSDTNWQSSQGAVQMGTVVDITAASIGVAKTWGLAGGAVGNATSDISVTQDVTIGSGSTLTALDDISILAGQNPAGRNVTEIDVLALGLAHFGGLAGDSGANATLTMTSASALSLASGAVVTSGGDVTVGATPGVNSTTQSYVHGYDRNFSKSSSSAGTVTESALATIDGQLQAGAYATLDVAFDTTGTQLTVNGVTTTLNTGTPDSNGVINQTIAPPSTPEADLFVPFQVAYIPQYTPSLAGFDQATAALLQSSVSSSPVVAAQLTGLAAQGGQVVLVADTLAGTGTLSANTPRIQLTNPSANYLLLNGVAIPAGQTAGQVTLKGATGAAPANPGLTLQPTVGESAIVVSQTWPAPVGTGTSSGPAIYVTNYLNNPSGEVQLSNAAGAVIELAPINAASVSIETPNSAFILNTPQAPFGIGGNITDAWGATRQPLNPQPGGSIPALAGAWLPGQTTTGWDANLAATTVVDYLFNGSSSNLGNGARTLSNASLSASNFAEYSLYNDSGVKSSNSPNHNPNGNSWIFFGNAIPFYNTGWSNGNSFGSTSDTREDAGQASWLGSGSGYYTNSSSNYYQFAYNGPGADAGALPLVLPNLPLQVTQPDTAVQQELSSGLTAAQVSITAALIDINAPLNVGVSRNLEIVLSPALGSTLAAYRADWQSGTQGSVTYTIPETDLGVGIQGVTATYNAQTNEITLGSIATSSATVSALLTGGLVSTVSTGKINMIGGPGLTSVTNATGIPLLLSGIDSGATQVTGLVEINDTIRQTSTKYVYTPGAGVDVYTAPLNQAYAATPDSTGGGSLQSYQPLSGLQINQQQSVGLVRELNFTTPGGTNNNGSTNIDEGNPAVRPAPVGFWNFANISGTVEGFGQFYTVSGAALNAGATELMLTDGVNNTASAAWLTSSLNTSVGFRIQFTYQASGAMAADGIALVFQNEGFNAVGGTGGDLGYVGITGSTAAYELNIYNGHTVGTNLVLTNTSGTYNATGNVNLASGDPIAVELIYDPLTQTMRETLTDTTTQATYTATHTGINLAQVVGESSFVGFTGGDGGATSIQTVSDFTLETDQTIPWSPPSTTLTLNGFGDFTGINTTPSSGGTSVELTNGSANIAAAAWKTTPLDLANGFAIGFVYQAGGNRAADGIALAFQTEGLTALGGTGGALGYVGLTGNTAAYQMNLYSGHGVGTNFVTTNTSGTYNATGSVNLASGDNIQVQLVYNPLQQVVVETLTDLSSGAVFTTTHTGIDLTAVLGSSHCYVGFTGGSGGDTAVQTVSNLVIALPSSLAPPVNSLLSLAANQVNLPQGTALAQFVTVAGTGNALTVNNKFGNNGSGPPWGVGNNNNWNFHYPTYYQLFQSSVVKADNPFAISFEAMQAGGLSVVSSADLVLDGLIRIAGDVTLSSVGSITQTGQGSIEAQNLDLIASPTAVLTGFGGTNSIHTTPTANSVTLTNGVDSTASAVWFNASLDTTTGWTAQFTYRAGGDRAADGVALVFQNQGLSALGNDGGALGYVGLTGNTAAYQMNLYTPHTVGTAFVTTNTSGTYTANGAVNIASGDPITVTLVYNPAAQTVTETLVDTVTGEVFSAIHTGINLAGLLGNSCLVGFTGADGGATSTQTVSQFSLTTQVTATVGTADTPLQINLTQGSLLDAFAPDGIYVTSSQNLVVDSVEATPLIIGGFTSGPAEWALVNGDAGIADFSAFTLVGAAAVTTVNGEANTLTLTNDLGWSASGAWAPALVSTSAFTVNFQYQATGDRQADGIAVVFQNAGTTALGTLGGGLGYVGIPGQTVAYEMNLYSLWGVGTNFVTTNSSTQYNSTGTVNIASGNPIAVQLVYDGITQTLTETLTETWSSGVISSYQHVYTDIRLDALLGPTAIFGFTGGDGDLTSIQQVSVLPGLPLFQQTVPELVGDALVAIPATGIGNQVSAAWHRTPVDITRDFQASFVYQAQGTNPADGLALVFQNQGLAAIGDIQTYGGSSLGYAGLNNNTQTAAYEINVYNGHVIGSNVALNGAVGTYNATGTVDFASGHRISVQLDYDASAATLTESLIDLETGDTWQRIYSLDLLAALDPGATPNTTNPQTALIGFTAANGAAFAEQIVSEFQFAYDVESTGDIVLSSTQGAVRSAGPGSLVRGGTITVNAATSAGSQSNPLNLRLDSQTLANGSVVGGVLNATVGTDLYVQQTAGNLRLGSVVATGTVSLTVTAGSITDGLAVDSSALNQVRSAKHRQQIQKQLWQAASDPARETIASYEALIDRNYVQYWNLVPNGSVAQGTFTLNSSAIPLFEAQAALYYGVASATDEQVQSWANLTYGNCVDAFSNTLAFGPQWATLLQFAAYDSGYVFVAPPTTVAALSTGSESVFGVVSTASLLALNSAAISGNGPGVNIAGAQQLNLVASGTVGLIQEPVVIPLSDISQQTLTLQQAMLLELASAKGALQMVGTSTTGETITYDFNNPPAGVTPTGVQATVSRPLFLNLATGGTVTATGPTVSLVQTVGDLNIDSIVATGPVRLEAQGSLLSTDSSLPAVTGSKLKLIAGGMLGSEANPFLIAATGIVDANAQQDLFLSQTAGDLQLGQVIAGGAASLQATGSILDGQVTNRENINGFGSNGTGWTSSVAGTPNAPQVSVVNDVTTFSNPANPGSATSASNFSMLFRDQTVNLAADWIIGFVYQSTGTQGGLSLTMNNGSSGAPLPTAGVGEFDSNASFVMNLPGHNFGDILANNVGFLSPVTFNMEEPTPLNLSSGHPIKVILSYSVSNQLLSAQLTDQTTGGQFVLSTPFNLIQALGTTLVRLSLQTFSTGATNLVQTVSNFVVLDGAANISAETLNASAGGGSLANTNAVVGSATTPLNLLVEEDITIIGPGGVNLLQMAGDLVVGSITANSSSTVSLAAPLGSIVGSVSAPGVMGVQSTSPVGTIDLKAGAANLSALGQIGTASTPLETQLAELSAVARLSRLHVNNRGALVIPAGSNGVGVAAGTTLQVTTSNALTIDAGVQAIGDVVLTVADLGLTHQSLIATPHARITSQTGTVGLFAPDALQLQPGSRIAVAGTGAGPQVTAGLTRFTPGATDALIQSLGQIVADRVSLAGGDRGTLFEVAHSGLMGQTRAPTVSVSGNTGIDRLVIHHRDAATGQSFTVSDSLLANPLAGYSLTSLDSVLLELGNFTDSVIVDRLRQLRDVEVRGFAGDDQFLVRFAPGSASRVVLDGGLGTNRLTYDGAGQALWVKPGVVQSLTSQVQHSLMQSLVPLNTPSLNGTPVLLGVDLKVLLAGLPPTQRYVEATFLQLVQRRPTSAELTKWTQSINVNPNDPARRLSLVNFLFDSDEGRTVQLQAWFQTFVGREATAVELVSWLKQYRAIKDPLVMQRSFLSSSVVVQYIQSLSTTGTAEQRYVEGVLRLMNDPGLRLTPADLQSWMTLRNRLGRTDFLAYLQKQPAYLQSQQEAFTEVLANANSQFTNLLIGAPKFTSHIDMWKWLLARRTV